MKRRMKACCFFSVWFWATMRGFSGTFYIAPDGSDASGDGSIDNPYETITQAQSVASAGDTVYLRGGTYYLETADITHTYLVWKSVNHITKNGIRYIAYKNEVPVFDFSGVLPDGYRVTAFLVEADNCVFEGFEVVGVQVTIADERTQSECFRIYGGDNNRFERLSMHDGMGIGWYLTRGGGNVVIDCDAYNNKGLNGYSHGNVDGFGAHADREYNTGNMFVGCRAWFNSDDGFDLINNDAPVTISNCWALCNGYDFESPESKIGDSTGFKAGGYGVSGGSFPASIPRNRVLHCLAVGNSRGFYANHHTGGLDWIHNTAINNGSNYNMLCNTNASSGGDVPGFDHYMRNNLGYGSGYEVSNLGSTNENDVAYNYWTLPVSVTCGDFESLEFALLTQARQADGSLPAVNYAHLAEGSDLIDAGGDIGLAYHDGAPDLGAFEFLTSTNAEPVAVELVELSAVADAALRFNAGANGDEGKNYGSDSSFYLRQLDGAPRDYFAYFRFDLSEVPGKITNAVFSVTRSEGDALNATRFRVLGVDAVAGNTPQDWSETEVSFNTLGAEVDTSIYPSPSAGTSPFDLNRVTDFDAESALVSERFNGDVASVFGASLAEWLEVRRNDGGLVTLIVDYPAAGDRDDHAIYYFSREAESGQPLLTVMYEAAPSSGYSVWIKGYPSVGVNTNWLDDADGDGVSNLGEYGLGGDPSDGRDSGQSPVGYLSDNEWFYFVYPQRQDAESIGYCLERATNLLDADWTNAFYEVVGAGVWSALEGFDAVTNRIFLGEESRQFLRLGIEELAY